jgi:HEAT repeat protein
MRSPGRTGRRTDAPRTRWPQTHWPRIRRPQPPWLRTARGGSPRSLGLALIAVLCATGTAQEDPARMLKSKDVKVRLEAVESLSRDEHPKAEQLLLKALDDDDWEVVEWAGVRLGSVGGPKSIKPLVELALEGPTRRIRRLAAQSLGTIDRQDAFDRVAKKLSGKSVLEACAALAVLGEGADVGRSSRTLEKLLGADEPGVPAAAAEALLVSAGDRRDETLTLLLEHELPSVQARALDAVAARPQTRDLGPLFAYLRGEGLIDLLERRALHAVAAVVERSDGAATGLLRSELPDGQGWTGSPELMTRRARLIGVLGAWTESEASAGQAGEAGLVRSGRVPSSLVDPALLLPLLDSAGSAEDPSTRAASARALAQIGTPEALQTLRGLVADDESGRVRWVALDGLVESGRIEDADVAAVVFDRLAHDDDVSVRERAAVALGHRGLQGATAALVTAAGDEAWAVAVSALVSLGKTAADDALEPLTRWSTEPDDWRLRGAATVGLIQLATTDAFPALFACLDDERLEVRSTAVHHLREISGKQHAAASATWRAWWAAESGALAVRVPGRVVSERYSAFSRRAELKLREGVEVIVITGSADKIEDVLTAEEVEHRRANPAEVSEAGLQPGSVLVVACPGALEEHDLEVVEWSVHSGSHLVSSCVALGAAVEQLAPGVVRMRGAVSAAQGDVEAQVCAPGSPYLRGAFGTDGTSMVRVQNRNLIEVLDPERVESLLDSPTCADRWGAGNLAARFRLGHGAVLNTANHLNLDGLQLASHLKSPAERQAFAVDHMGMDYELLRESRGEAFWKSNTKASREIFDRSVMRLVHNIIVERGAEGF